MGKKTKIEWSTMTWNPVTGCYHGCKYCYARRIAERFKAKHIYGAGINVAYLGCPFMNDGKKEPYPFGFKPTFHAYRLDEPQLVKEGQNIFVCSMADLFGEWVPDEWITRVFDACKAAPQHTYLFLTKNPERYSDLMEKGLLPDLPNFWYGTTVTGSGDRFAWFDRFANWYLSVEPLLSPMGTYGCGPAEAGAMEKGALPPPGTHPGWVIIGAETGNRKGKVVPQKEWIDNIVAKCRMMGAKVFMKDSLIPIVGEENMIREFPSGLWRES